MNRHEVYKVIDSERNFQDKHAGTATRPDIKKEMTMGDFLSAMEYNIYQAKAIWYKDSPPYHNTMDMIRKVIALGIKAAEQYGIPERKE